MRAANALPVRTLRFWQQRRCVFRVQRSPVQRELGWTTTISPSLELMGLLITLQWGVLRVR